MRVSGFRVYATDLYEEHGVTRQVHALIDGLVLEGVLVGFHDPGYCGFQSTWTRRTGKSQRHHDPGSSRSKKQFGMGWSLAAVSVARHIATVRCMGNGVRHVNWQQCFARAAALEAEGVPAGVINPATPVPELLAHLIELRR